MKYYLERVSPNLIIWSVSGNGYWYISTTRTYDQAFRDCRNFIKRNQGRLF